MENFWLSFWPKAKRSCAHGGDYIHSPYNTVYKSAEGRTYKDHDYVLRCIRRMIDFIVDRGRENV